MVYRSRRRYSQSPSCPPGWSWLLAGILIGVFLSFLVYLQGVDSSAPVEPEQVVEAPIKQKTPPTEANATSPSPRFEFYDILPQSATHLPVQAVSEVESSPTRVAKPVTTRSPVARNKQPALGTQILQVGAFRGAQEAKGLKAHLALLGVRAQVRASSEDNSGVWHRVEVGPVRDFAQLERLQTKLKAHNIGFIVQTID